LLNLTSHDWLDVVTRRRLIGVLLIALLMWLIPSAAAASSAASSASLRIGFFDGVFDGSDSALWLQRAASADANVVIVNIGWVAPNDATKPAGFNALDPGSPDYDFTSADAAVKAATADGLRVILQFTGAPQWAEGPDIPADAAPGTWEPNDSDIKQYAVALGKRYSGRYPDPADPGHKLPKVWGFQLWNEPNMPDFLAPQWVNGRAVSPIIYRGMLNAFYKGIKAFDPGALVVTAGTGPFGDPPPYGPRVMPAMFWRGVLCVDEVGAAAAGGAGTGLRAYHCKDPAHFDVLAHHPYSVGAPDTAALNADDVSIPDMGKLNAILRVAEAAGTALPHIHHQLWATETGYNTDPPNPKGVPIDEAARWMDQTLELLSGEGVSLVTFDTIVDQPPDPSYFTTSQSGVYFVDGETKPTLTAFELPFVVSRARGVVSFWGRAPIDGIVRIEVRRGDKWLTVSSLNVKSTYTFRLHLVDSGHMTVRARLGALTSIAWILR
jgi:hypothetical protein